MYGAIVRVADDDAPALLIFSYGNDSSERDGVRGGDFAGPTLTCRPLITRRAPFKTETFGLMLHRALAFLLVGGLLLLMLFCGWLYAGASGAVISTGLGAIALMLVRKVSPQFFLVLSGARSINSEDMPALFGIIAALCRRADIAKLPGLYFLPSGVPTAFATGVADQSVIVVSSELLRLLMTRELTGGLCHVRSLYLSIRRGALRPHVYISMR